MYRAAAVGSYESIYGYAAAGMEIMPVGSAAECAETVKKAAASDFGVLFITEEYAYEPEVREAIKTPVPAVLVIPGAEGSSGRARAELHEMVEKAAGADLLNEKE